MKSASLQYANALADVALAQGAAAATAEQLADFNAACAASAELRTVLATPAVSKEQKRAIAEKVAAQLGAGKIVRNFLFLVIDHRRTHELPAMLSAFQSVLRERQGVASAEVVSASPLSDAQKNEMTRTLSTVTGKTIEANFSLDPNLLGGALVRVGDTVYDGSLRKRLAEMREQLLAE